MAQPNIVNVVSIFGQTSCSTLTTDIATPILSCNADDVIKINSIIAANINGDDPAKITVFYYSAAQSRVSKLANEIIIPAHTTLVVLGKDSPIYLIEGDQLRAGSDLATAVDVTVSYEVLRD